MLRLVIQLLYAAEIEAIDYEAPMAGCLALEGPHTVRRLLGPKAPTAMPHLVTEASTVNHLYVNGK